MTTWFDESRLDDEQVLAVRRRAAAPARRVRRPRAPRGRRGGRGDAWRRSSGPATWSDRGRSSPPARTPGCCARCSSRGARCRSWPGRGRPARLGGQPRPRRRPGARGVRPRHRLRRRRGGPPRLPGRRRLPAALAGRRARRRPLDHDPARRDRRPARHRGGDARLPRPGRPRPARRRREVADALDDVAIACSPHRDLAVNPAKMLAIALADTTPLVWGGSVLAARAARRVAESVRRASGRTALAGDAEHLLPVLEAARRRDVFDDPFADDGSREPGRCCWSSTTAPRTRSSASSAAGCGPRPPSAASGSRRSPPTAEHRGGPLRLAAADRAATPRSTSGSDSSEDGRESR